MSKKRNFYLAVILINLAIVTGCTTVKEYQKGKLNDSEMVLGQRKIQKTEASFQSYREGASGVNGGKTGGGCGCN
jgi:hypothetical protein